jgi:hypothetical protein
MKTRTLLAFAPLVLGALIQGCLDVEITTKVRTDGSLTRTVEISGDSSETVLGCRLMGVDSTWVQRIDTNANKKTRLVATKEFRSDNEATRALMGVPLKRPSIVLKLERHFRWFTTSYRYEETWKKIYPFDHVPMNNYLSKWDLEMLRVGSEKKDSTSTEGDKRAIKDAIQRATEWVRRNTFEEYVSRVIEGVKMINDPSLPADSVTHAKSRIFSRVGGFFDSHKTMVDDSIRLGFVAELKNTAILKAIDTNAASLKEFEDILKFVEEVDGPQYKANVIVPGLITDTNAGTVEGNKVRWENFKDFALYFGDYTMWVESRVVNWWIIVGTGLVVVAIGFMMVLGLVRNRRPGMAAG